MIRFYQTLWRTLQLKQDDALLQCTIVETARVQVSSLIERQIGIVTSGAWPLRICICKTISYDFLHVFRSLQNQLTLSGQMS